MPRPKGIPFSEEYAGQNYAEFSVTRKADAQIMTRRLLFILLYLAFAVIYCVVFLVLTKIGTMIAILPLFLLILWLVTWRFTKIDYTYIVYQGQFHIYRVNGFNKAKEVLNAKLSENDGIYPAADADYASLAAECASSLDFSAGKNTADMYFARFVIDGAMTAVYFTAAAKLLTSLRYYGGENVVVTYVSR